MLMQRSCDADLKMNAHTHTLISDWWASLAHTRHIMLLKRTEAVVFIEMWCFLLISENNQDVPFVPSSLCVYQLICCWFRSLLYTSLIFQSSLGWSWHEDACICWCCVIKRLQSYRRHIIRTNCIDTSAEKHVFPCTCVVFIYSPFCVFLPTEQSTLLLTPRPKRNWTVCLNPTPRRYTWCRLEWQVTTTGGRLPQCFSTYGNISSMLVKCSPFLLGMLLSKKHKPQHVP